MSLRKIIHNATGVNLYQCRMCGECDLKHLPEQDVSLGMLAQMVVMDDEEVLTTRTLWMDAVLEESKTACRRGINLHAVLLALREEATRRQK